MGLERVLDRQGTTTPASSPSTGTKSAFGYGSTNETTTSDKLADAPKSTFAWPSASTSNGTPNSAFPFSHLLLRMTEMHPHARFLANVEQVDKVRVFNSIKG